MTSFGFQWHLTDRCNQRCAHCYQERWQAGDELDLAGWQTLADRIFTALADRRVSVNLTGGEPLLLADLPALVDHLHEKPNLEEAWVITNGTLAPRPLLDRLATGPRLAGFKVSVEAADAASDDAVRGAGHFEGLEANLEALLATGKQVVAMVTLGRHNTAGVEGTVAWARKRGLAGVLFERFVPLGHGRAMAGQVLSDADWRSAARAIAACAQETLTVDELGCLRAYWIAFGDGPDELRAATCSLGAESMALMPDATVTPCRRYPEPVGNALDEPFTDILGRLARRAPLPGGGCAALHRAKPTGP